MKKFLLSFLVVAISLSATAQDIHFSQFNASPLTLNPALTGKLECTYRAALNYRNQWNSIPAPFVTYSGAFDAALWKNRLGGDAVGIGAMVFNDVAGDGNLQNLNMNLSLAYHKALGEGHLLSAGFQGTFVQRGVDFSRLIFPSQIGSGGVNPNLPNGEQNAVPNFTYFDLQTGIHWSSVLSDRFSFNIGGAYYHILQPIESFYDDKTNRLAPRFVAHGGVSASVSDNISISPSILFMSQENARQINFGSSLGYHLDNAILYFGAWHRWEDAIIVLTGLEFQNLMFGFSYDITVSSAAKASNHKGGFELSLTYNGCIATTRRVTHCPKF